MFTCPEKDIHSLYLDGELPQNFSKDYEEHIASCEKCRKELERMRAVHNVFASDAASMNLDKAFMEESYKRLKSRMRFNNVVKMSEPKKRFAPLVKTFIPMAAAAAAVFAVMLPLNMKSSQSVIVSEDFPIISKVQNITPISKNDVFIEGGLQEVAQASKQAKIEQQSANANAKNLGIKASSFVNKEEDETPGMTIRLTELVNLNSISAAEVSFDQFSVPDFLK